MEKNFSPSFSSASCTSLGLLEKKDERMRESDDDDTEWSSEKFSTDGI